MKYQAQMRTQMFSGSWSEWTSIGDPMDSKEADDFVASWDNLMAQVTEIRSVVRVIVIPDRWPRVFSP